VKRVGYIALFLFAVGVDTSDGIRSAVIRTGMGTIVVVTVTKARAYIAADSRTTFTDDDSLTNDRCKVIALGEDFLFASTGRTTLESVPDKSQYRWDSNDEARNVYGPLSRSWQRVNSRKAQVSGGNENRFVDAVADRWAEGSMWTMVEFLGIAKNDILQGDAQGGIVTGIFVGNDPDGRLTVTARTIRRIPGSRDFEWVRLIPTNFKTSITLRFGRTEIVQRLLQPTTTAEKREAHEFLQEIQKKPRDEQGWFRTFKLAQLTVQRHPNQREVGGEIDVAELARGRKVRWIQRKKACAEAVGY
jgi:hypothetical protein